ncbi:MAG: alpha/beta hydrolase [Burkholderiales bacterium]|nr:alpha/beta hydrolase [Burkholderiales bacterium]
MAIQGCRIEYRLIRSAPGAPVLVFLHEGLGSLSAWRDFPGRVAHAAGCEALVYSRAGYGASAAVRGPRAPRFMHDEALAALPALLERLGFERPILFGHSDGASIALIHAGGAGRRVAGVIAMAPHVFVEDVCIQSIRRAKRAYETAELRARLARHHADPDAAFRGWCDIWLDPAFREWNIEEYLPRIACPVLAIQGEDDEYGTMAQLERIARLAPDAQVLRLADCRHAPHRDQPRAVLEAAVRFVGRVRAAA